MLCNCLEDILWSNYLKFKRGQKCSRCLYPCGKTENGKRTKIIENIAKVYLAKKYPKEESLWSADILFGEIIELTLNAKFFEKQQKTENKFVGEFTEKGRFASGRVVATNNPKALEHYAKANNLTLERVFSEPKDFQLV